MADFTTMRLMFNSGTDATPVWNAVTFGGSAGQQELRWCAAGAGSASIASASWPQYARPVATGPVPEVWAYTSADATGGVKVATYDGTNGKANVFCIDYDALGSYATAPTLSAWGDNTHVAPVQGTQPGAFSGSPIVNGHATDTTSFSYLKATTYGTAQAANPAAGAAGTTVLVTSGTAGSVSPGAGAWLATWQSLQGAIQFITHPATPAALTAGKIFFSMILFSGPNLSLGTFVPVLTYTYSFV